MSHQPATVIMIEDNHQIVRLIRDMFRHCDFQFVHLTSADFHCLPDMLEAKQPIVVIMDYMTIYDEYELAVGSMPLHIPTVILTPVEEEKFATNVDYCIKTPFSPSQFYGVMRDIIRQSAGESPVGKAL